MGTGWEERPSNRTLQVMIRSVVSGGKVEEERDAIVCKDVKAIRHKMARGMVYGDFIFVICLLSFARVEHENELRVNQRTSTSKSYEHEMMLDDARAEKAVYPPSTSSPETYPRSSTCCTASSR
jgi:hypothetical protein